MKQPNYSLIERDFDGQNFLSISDYSRAALLEVLNFAPRMKPIVDGRQICQVLLGRVMGAVFLNPSTRTITSSSVACKRLGGTVETLDLKQSSMVEKGETFSGTMVAFGTQVNMITIRSKEKGHVTLAAKVAGKPVINAGDHFEHPTQALLDGLTFKEGMKDRGKDLIRGRHVVVIAGDLKYARTAHSFMMLMAVLCDNITFRLVSPDFLRMPQEVVQFGKERGARVEEDTDFVGAIQGVDGIYMNRPQRENMSPEERERWAICKTGYRLDKTIFMENCRQDTLIAHPGPRNEELSTCLDGSPNDCYSRIQPINGTFVRMTLLTFISGKAREIG